MRPVRIISCGVFRPALDALCLVEKYPWLNVTYLQSNLHINPQGLKSAFLEEMFLSQKRNERAICLYGECFKDIDLLCKEHGVVKCAGHSCYEMLLGRENFRHIMEENAKTYFLEKELILNFNEYCVGPLELYDKDMRELFFKNYERLIYIHQPSDPDLLPAVYNIAGFLGLSVLVHDADYAGFEKALSLLIGCGQ